MRSFDEIIYDRAKLVYRGKACPSATSFTTDSTWTALGLNPDLSGRNAATNVFSYGMFTFDTRRKIFWYLQQPT
jgi:hypothetical protein